MYFFEKVQKNFQHLVRSARIGMDFPRYQAEQLVAHELAANRRYDTTRLEQEIQRIREVSESEGYRTFNVHIRYCESSIEAIRPTIFRLRKQLEILSRDYKQELNLLYQEKSNLVASKHMLFDEMKSLQRQRSDAKENLSDAYDELDDAKSSIDSWHEKSQRTPWLFGNGGRHLPQHSLFGQSFGDLSGYKSERTDAYNGIDSRKKAIKKIVDEQKAINALLDQNRVSLDRVSKCISDVKEARQGMHDLHDQGVLLHRVQADLSAHLLQEADLKRELDRFTCAKADLIESHARRMGIEERKLAVAALIKQRAQLLASFDEPEQKADRKRAHRQWWLKSHGVT